MVDIPEDVIARGNELQDLYGDGRQGYVAFDIAVLAILAERQRCADVANDLVSDLKEMKTMNRSYAVRAAYNAKTAILS